MGSRYLGRHASVLAAMLAHRVPEPEALSLIRHAEAAGRRDIQVVIQGRVLNFRWLRGNHCDVHALPWA